MIFGPGDEFVTVLARLVRLSPVVYPLPGGGHGALPAGARWAMSRRRSRICLERSDTAGRAFSLGGPEPLTLREIATRVLEAMGARRVLVGAPIAALRPLVARRAGGAAEPAGDDGIARAARGDNVTPDNALEPVFDIKPTPFTAEQLGYLREITAGDAVRSLFRRG